MAVSDLAEQLEKWKENRDFGKYMYTCLNAKDNRFIKAISYSNEYQEHDEVWEMFLEICELINKSFQIYEKNEDAKDWFQNWEQKFSSDDNLIDAYQKIAKFNEFVEAKYIKSNEINEKNE